MFFFLGKRVTIEQIYSKNKNYISFLIKEENDRFFYSKNIINKKIDFQLELNF
jgi:hypothetical protein